MDLLAVAFPIPPGRTDQWRRFMAELNGPRRPDYEGLTQRTGARWRVFLQQTPEADLALVTAEGADPAESFQKLAADGDSFTQWFLKQVLDIHGVDLRNPPGPLPELVLDSQHQ
jgi:hypothetical protein